MDESSGGADWRGGGGGTGRGVYRVNPQIAAELAELLKRLLQPPGIDVTFRALRALRGRL